MKPNQTASLATGLLAREQRSGGGYEGGMGPGPGYGPGPGAGAELLPRDLEQQLYGMDGNGMAGGPANGGPGLPSDLEWPLSDPNTRYFIIRRPQGLQP